MSSINLKFPPRFPINFDEILKKMGYINIEKYDVVTVTAQKKGVDYFFQFPKFPYLQAETLMFDFGTAITFDDYLSILPPITLNQNSFRFVNYGDSGNFNFYTVEEWFHFLLNNRKRKSYKF